jgi:hypothetical protein
MKGNDIPGEEHVHLLFVLHLGADVYFPLSFVFRWEHERN